MQNSKIQNSNEQELCLICFRKKPILLQLGYSRQAEKSANINNETSIAGWFLH